jgi:hypothetical protein
MSTKEKYKYTELPTEPNPSNNKMSSLERDDLPTEPMYTSLPLDVSPDPGELGGESLTDKASPNRDGTQNNVELGEGDPEGSEGRKTESLVRRLYRWYKGMFVGSITDSEVANMITAYGRPLKTFRTHRKFRLNFTKLSVCEQ